MFHPPRLLPQHIAIILDGNGRWAEERGYPRIRGHAAGARRVKEIVTYCSEIGLPALTLYAFSTENWKRPRAEVSFLMQLLRRYIHGEREKILKNNIVLRILGNPDSLPRKAAGELREVSAISEKNTGMRLNFALSYGGRDEIVRASRKLAKTCLERNGDPETIDEEAFSAALDTAGLPDPDLLIRTSGEQRISNFLLWQIAYSELYFVEKYWPDFTTADLEAAIEEFSKRQRRFGKVEENDMSS